MTVTEKDMWNTVYSEAWIYSGSEGFTDYANEFNTQTRNHLVDQCLETARNIVKNKGAEQDVSNYVNRRMISHYDNMFMERSALFRLRHCYKRGIVEALRQMTQQIEIMENW